MAEELMDFGYAAWAKRSDLIHILVFAAILAGISIDHLGAAFAHEVSCQLMLFASLAIAGVVVAGQARWRSRGRLTERGIAMSSGPDGPWTELSWVALEEIRLFLTGGFEVIGVGTRVRVPRTMENVTSLPDEVLRRYAPALFDRLRAAYRRGEELEFRGPRDPHMALALSLAALFFMGVPIVLTLGSPLIQASIPFCGIPLLLVLRAEFLRSQRVTLDRTGLRRRRGFRTLVIPWEGMRAAGLRNSGTLRITLTNGASISLPPTLSNFVVLQEIVLARVLDGIPDPRA